MTLNRWKVLACTLTIGVGGLAVFATPPAGNKSEPPKEPAPLADLAVKPITPVNGSDTPVPDTPAKGAESVAPNRSQIRLERMTQLRVEGGM